MPFKSVIKRYGNWVNLSIYRRLIVWSIGFLLITIAIFSLTVLWIGQTRMIKDAAQRNTHLASIVSRDINSQVSNIYSDARNFTGHLETIPTDPTTQAGAVLSLLIASPQRYKAVYYFDESGNLLFQLANTRAELESFKNGQDVISQPAPPLREDVVSAFARVVNGIDFSDVSFTGTAKDPSIFIGMPISTTIGGSRVVIFEIDLSDIWQTLNRITIGKTGFVYAVSRTGTIISYPDSTYIGRQLSSNLNPLLSGYEGYTEYTEQYNHTPVLSAYSPVGGQLGWGIVVQQDRDEAYAAIARTGYLSIGILLIFTIAGTAGIFIMVRNFTRPMVDLTMTASRIAETGDLTAAPAVESPDEVGRMSHAFNRMIDRIRQSENMFRSIVENSHSGIFIIDSSFHLIYANNQLADMLGGTREQIIGHDFREFLDEESKNMVAERYLRRQRGEDMPSRYEFGFVRHDGEKRIAELSSTVIKNAENQTVTIGQILDITERKMAERELLHAHNELEQRVRQRTADLTNSNVALQQEIVLRKETEERLRQSETRYRALVENSSSIVLEMDPEGRVVYINPFAQQFFGYSEEEILGRNVVGTIVPEVDSSGRDLRSFIADVTKNPDQYYNSENENMRSNGERVWVAWTNKGQRDKDNKLVRILCTGIDRTEPKRAAIILEEKARSEATQAERIRLARDLHDAVSQTLFSASLIAEVVPRLWDKNTAEGKKRLEEVRQLTRGALAEMRTLLFELRPAALADAELGELLRHLTESVTGRSRVQVSLEINGACLLTPNVKIALYRIAQEALNNVGKHSGAGSAKVTLQCSPHSVVLHIVDDGRGFDITQLSSGHFGLDNMRERAASIGATLDIESNKNKGTEVIVIWQNHAEEEE